MRKRVYKGRGISSFLLFLSLFQLSTITKMPFFGREFFSPSHLLNHPAYWLKWIFEQSDPVLKEMEVGLILQLKDDTIPMTDHYRASAWMLYTTIIYEHRARHMNDSEEPWEFARGLEDAVKDMSNCKLLRSIVKANYPKRPSGRNTQNEPQVEPEHEPQNEPEIEPPMSSSSLHPSVPSLSDLPRYSELDKITDIDDEGTNPIDVTSTTNDHAEEDYYAATTRYSQWVLERTE